MRNKGICIRAGWQARPLYFPKPIRHPILLARCVIDHDRQQEGHIRRHQVTTVYGELPFKPKIPLTPGQRVFRYHRNEQGATLDLPPDRRIPDIAAAKCAPVEPNLYARCAQRTANAFSSFYILRGVADEHTGSLRRTGGSLRIIGFDVVGHVWAYS